MSVFYACDNAFMEIFCVCIELMNKTWKEMRATVNDLDRVRHSIFNYNLQNPYAMPLGHLIPLVVMYTSNF